MGGCKNDGFNPTFKGCFPIIPLDFTKVIPFNPISFSTVSLGDRFIKN
jgi:hypothetical protein